MNEFVSALDQTLNPMKLKIGLFVTSLEKDFNKTPASYWIRILQMIDYYKESGAEVYLNKYLKRYDVAIVFWKPKRKYYYIVRYLRLISMSVYFDTCINIFNLHEEIDDHRLKYARKIAETTDGLICASHRIAEHAKPYARDVYVMEDPVNIRHFIFRKKDINFDRPVFGWSGVGVKSVYLNQFAQEITDRIIIISEPQILSVPLKFNYQYIPWDYKTFPTELLKCDIALLPRDYSDPYNDSHSSFKALVFAAQGIPVIASKVPSYVELSRYYDGMVFLEDFDNCLEKCITALKERDTNPQRVRNHYSCENQANGLIRYFSNKLKS